MSKYQRPLIEDEELLNSFLDSWPISKVEKMTLEEYTDVENKSTFTQWVETRTRSLGSINGQIGSAKFGLYKRHPSSTKPKSRVLSNDNYSWIKYYGISNYDENEVFEKVRGELLRLIGYAQEFDFDAIEKFKGFYEIYKWKVAFLYSNQSIIPVFNQALLKRFSEEFGLKNTKIGEYAKQHRFLYDQKPPNISVFNFMRKLFNDAGLFEKKKKNISTKISKRKKGRKGTDDLNTDDQPRKGTKDTIATQRHKKFQKKLMSYLKKNHPKAEITFEKNFIDLLLVSGTEVHYYEVKTALASETCIKQGLGQLLSYSFYEEQVLKKHEGLKKKIVIVGQLKPKEYDLEFIKYVNDSLNVNFEYFSLEEIEPDIINVT